jgi:hypothetical protein
VQTDGGFVTAASTVVVPATEAFVSTYDFDFVLPEQQARDTSRSGGESTQAFQIGDCVTGALGALRDCFFSSSLVPERLKGQV